MDVRSAWIGTLVVIVAVSVAECGNDSAGMSGAASGPPPPPAEIAVTKMPVMGLANDSLVRGSANVVYIWRGAALHPLVTRSSAAAMQNGMQVVPNGWIDLTFLGLGPSTVLRLSDEDIEKLPKGAEVDASKTPR